MLLCLSELGVIKGTTSIQAKDEAQRNLSKKIPGAMSDFDELIAHAVTVQPNSSELNAWERFASERCANSGRSSGSRSTLACDLQFEGFL